MPERQLPITGTISYDALYSMLRASGWHGDRIAKKSLEEIAVIRGLVAEPEASLQAKQLTLTPRKQNQEDRDTERTSANLIGKGVFSHGSVPRLYNGEAVVVESFPQNSRQYSVSLPSRGSVVKASANSLPILADDERSSEISVTCSDRPSIPAFGSLSRDALGALLRSNGWRGSTIAKSDMEKIAVEYKLMLPPSGGATGPKEGWQKGQAHGLARKGISRSRNLKGIPRSRLDSGDLSASSMTLPPDAKTFLDAVAHTLGAESEETSTFTTLLNQIWSTSNDSVVWKCIKSAKKLLTGHQNLLDGLETLLLIKAGAVPSTPIEDRTGMKTKPAGLSNFVQYTTVGKKADAACVHSEDRGSCAKLGSSIAVTFTNDEEGDIFVRVKHDGENRPNIRPPTSLRPLTAAELGHRRPFLCSACGSRFETEGGLDTHWSWSHPQDVTGGNDDIAAHHRFSAYVAAQNNAAGDSFGGQPRPILLYGNRKPPLYRCTRDGCEAAFVTETSRSQHLAGECTGFLESSDDDDAYEYIDRRGDDEETSSSCTSDDNDSINDAMDGVTDGTSGSDSTTIMPKRDVLLKYLRSKGWSGTTPTKARLVHIAETMGFRISGTKTHPNDLDLYISRQRSPIAGQDPSGPLVGAFDSEAYGVADEPKRCRCGSSRHKKMSSSECPLNGLNRQAAAMAANAVHTGRLDCFMCGKVCRSEFGLATHLSTHLIDSAMVNVSENERRYNLSNRPSYCTGSCNVYADGCTCAKDTNLIAVPGATGVQPSELTDEYGISLLYQAGLELENSSSEVVPGLNERPHPLPQSSSTVLDPSSRNPPAKIAQMIQMDFNGVTCPAARRQLPSSNGQSTVISGYSRDPSAFGGEKQRILCASLREHASLIVGGSRVDHPKARRLTPVGTAVRIPMNDAATGSSRPGSSAAAHLRQFHSESNPIVTPVFRHSDEKSGMVQAPPLCIRSSESPLLRSSVPDHRSFCVPLSVMAPPSVMPLEPYSPVSRSKRSAGISTPTVPSTPGSIGVAAQRLPVAENTVKRLKLDTGV